MTSDSFRLSPRQRQWWRASELMAIAPLRARFELPEGVGVQDVRRVLDELSNHHEALRLRFAVDPRREPFQQVPEEQRPPVTTTPPATDWDWWRQPVVTVFEPGSLVVVAAPIALDPESLRLLGADLRRRLAGVELADDDNRLQFLDLSEWELELAPPGPPATAGTLAPIDLPSGEVRDAAATVTLDPQLAARLGDRAAAEKITLDEMVLAAWFRVLARYAADDETPSCSPATARAGSSTARRRSWVRWVTTTRSRPPHRWRHLPTSPSCPRSPTPRSAPVVSPRSRPARPAPTSRPPPPR
ncbi:hypothetical protein [Micromonospora sp. WMMA1976]|uniref:hypothetical protein n=1 Tax=Micromonospora sp. WMMA1976 TaxID=3014995 RepID=UPI00248CE93E|nr:hypothetical protein [Micromonospora sp. WMMA1976]WBC01111.1 hypothetical protein O7546_18260 [Micromonospora sp. WMMA1976]